MGVKPGKRKVWELKNRWASCSAAGNWQLATGNWQLNFTGELLRWEHIKLTGDYLWRSSAKVGAGKFRPLQPLSKP